jgi:hypothetical protein
MRSRSPLALASAALFAAGCATPSQPSAEKDPAVEVQSTGTPGVATAVRRQSMTATVKSVDVAGRAVSLEWQGGQTGTFKVGPEVKRFDEIFAGDAVQIEVEQQLRLEVQLPGAASVPFTVAGTAGRAGPGAAPGGAAVAGLQVTVTVATVDFATRLVMLKDPAGAKYEVKAGPGLHIEKLQVGDRFLATYVEAMAVRLEKPAKP